MQEYIRAGVVKIEEVLPHVTTREKVEREYLGHQVRMNSLRYHTFKEKGLVCCKCGIKGQYFALERAKFSKVERYHLNLYALDEFNNEVLMTKDHIFPKSKGGKDHLDNLITMCWPCNFEKGTHVEKDSALAKRLEKVVVNINKMLSKLKEMDSFYIIDSKNTVIEGEGIGFLDTRLDKLPHFVIDVGGHDLFESQVYNKIHKLIEKHLHKELLEINKQLQHQQKPE